MKAPTTTLKSLFCSENLVLFSYVIDLFKAVVWTLIFVCLKLRFHFVCSAVGSSIIGRRLIIIFLRYQCVYRTKVLFPDPLIKDFFA